MTTVLVIDVGTSSVRAGLVGAGGQVTDVADVATPPSSPAPGLMEFDAEAMMAAVMTTAGAVAERHSRPVDAVAVTNQRASVVAWDRTTGAPLAPGIGWQDLRTTFTCLELRPEGFRLAPNASATKIAALLDAVDPDRSRSADGSVAVGTVESWVVWHLTDGRAHVTDATNASVTDLVDSSATAWDRSVADRLSIPMACLPTIVDTVGHVGDAVTLPGSPPVLAMIGDQQASLVGQGGTAPGVTKITFGTGAMLDIHLGSDRVDFERRGPRGGTFPLVCWQVDGRPGWGVEAPMLSAGSNVEWLVRDLGLLDHPAQSHDVASACDHTDGVVYVPALMGLGAPHWDFGARGTLLGITRGTERRHIVRAVLEGVAQRGTDLIDAAEADTGRHIDIVRIDGGMSRNPTFVTALAHASGRRVEVSPEVEATSRGAGLMGLLGSGALDSLGALADTWAPAAVVDGCGTPADREQWADALDRARGWDASLSSLEF